MTSDVANDGAADPVAIRADLMLGVLVDEFLTAAAASPPMRVCAMTSNVSLVAALAARHLGAPIDIAVGFTRLSGDPRPALSLGAAALGIGASPRAPIVDTFVALARGWIGVVTSPGQLDARCRSNLSRVGGTDHAPGVALPGSRGIPENNTSPSRVWYLVVNHSPRTLVAEVDFVSGPEPRVGAHRRLLTGLGLFEYRAGWHALGRMAGVGVEQISEATGFEISGLADAPELTGPRSEVASALDVVDPDRLSHFELGRSAAEMGGIIGAERKAWTGGVAD